MQKTSNYGLNKPESTDFYNIEDMNENMDILDRHKHETLATPRMIGRASFDGSKDIQSYDIMGRVLTKSSGSASEYVNYHFRFARIDVSDGANKYCNGTFNIAGIGTYTLYGQLRFFIKTGSTVSTQTIILEWQNIYNVDLANDVTCVKVQDGIFDLYIKQRPIYTITAITLDDVVEPQRVKLFSNEMPVESVEAIATSSLGGNVNKANITDRLSNTETIGTDKQPVYFSADGLPIPCGNVSDMIIADGSNVLANSLADAPIIYLKNDGKTEQNGTPTPTAPIDVVGCGVDNLINATLETTEKYGVTCTKNNDETYTLSGKNTGDADVWFAIGTVDIPSGKYKVVGCFANGSETTYHLELTSVTTGASVFATRDMGSGRTFSIEGGQYKVNFCVRKGVSVSGVLKPMLTTNLNSTIDMFVPFTNGGYALPIKMCGKNLLNYDEWKKVSTANGTSVFENNGVTITATTNDAFTGGYTTFSASAIPVKKGKTYTLSWEESTNKEGKIIIFFNGSTTNSVSALNSKTKQLSYTATEDGFITFRFGNSVAGTTISYKNIQVEVGDTATPYEPYVEPRIVSIPIGDSPLYEGDYIEVFADGSGEIARNNGALNVTKWDGVINPLTESIEARVFTPTDADISKPIYCTIAKKVSNTWDVDKVGIMTYGGTDNSRICVRVPIDAKLTDYPCKIVYGLLEPTRTPLTAEQIAEFKKLHTFNGVTNVSADGTVSVRYYCNSDGGDTVRMLHEMVENKNHVESADKARSAETATVALKAMTADNAEYSSNADRLSNTKAIGSKTKPVYFDENGVPVPIEHEVNNSIPADGEMGQILVKGDNNDVAWGNLYETYSWNPKAVDTNAQDNISLAKERAYYSKNGNVVYIDYVCEGIEGEDYLVDFAGILGFPHTPKLLMSFENNATNHYISNITLRTLDGSIKPMEFEYESNAYGIGDNKKYSLKTKEPLTANDKGAIISGWYIAEE